MKRIITYRSKLDRKIERKQKQKRNKRWHNIRVMRKEKGGRIHMVPILKEKKDRRDMMGLSGNIMYISRNSSII